MLQPPKGTRDLLAESWAPYRTIFRCFEEVLLEYNYSYAELPLFESTQVFSRGLGDETDISKEMYSFEDRNGDSFTLRPEGTAGLVRAFISNSLHRSLPVKLAYAGPMFRYERPQKGRYRQFYQLGVEALGASSPWDDVESLDLAHRFLSKLGLEKRVQLEINSLGDALSRSAYLKVLVDYFSGYRDKLSPESQKRLQVNPLRLLDSKQEADQEILGGAPKMEDHLTLDAKAWWEDVKKGLEALEIPYIVNPRLVRGLDYYCHTVFEFTTKDLGTQNAVLSGGRYDGLVEALGGPKTPAIGWAAGWDRLALMEPKAPRVAAPLAILPLDADQHWEALKLAQKIRRQNRGAEIIWSGNMSKKLKKAARLESPLAIMVGGEEGKKGLLTVKDLNSGEQTLLSEEAFLKSLASR